MWKIITYDIKIGDIVFFGDSAFVYGLDLDRAYKVFTKHIPNDQWVGTVTEIPPDKFRRFVVVNMSKGVEAMVKISEVHR